MAELDPDLELGASHTSSSTSHMLKVRADLHVHDSSLGSAFEVMVPNGLDSLASELAHAEDGADDISSISIGRVDTEGRNGRLPTSPIQRPPTVKASVTSVSDGTDIYGDATLNHEVDEDIVVGTANLEASLLALNPFLDQLRSAANESQTEQKCSSLLRAVSALVKQRDAQARDLESLSKALAGLTPLQISMLEPLQDSEGAGVERDPALSVVAEEDIPISPGFSPETSPVLERQGRPSSTSKVFKDVHAYNASLLSSLRTVSESIQVAHAAQADLSRRLKSLKSTLATWRAELDDLEKLELAERRRDVSSVTESTLAAVRSELEAAEQRMHALFASAI